MEYLVIIKKIILASLASCGFAVLFNVPKEFLKYCALAGAIAYGTRVLFLFLGLNIEWATLIAAFVVGSLAIYLAKKYQVTKQAFTISAVIPLIPGSFAFSVMLAILKMHNLGYSEELMSYIIENGLKTSFILLALGFGLALPSLLFFAKDKNV